MDTTTKSIQTGYCVLENDTVRRVSCLDDVEAWLESQVEQEQIFVKTLSKNLDHWNQGATWIRSLTTKKQIEKDIAEHRAALQSFNHSLQVLRQGLQGPVGA